MCWRILKGLCQSSVLMLLKVGYLHQLRKVQSINWFTLMTDTVPLLRQPEGAAPPRRAELQAEGGYCLQGVWRVCRLVWWLQVKHTFCNTLRCENRRMLSSESETSDYLDGFPVEPHSTWCCSRTTASHPHPGDKASSDPSQFMPHADRFFKIQFHDQNRLKRRSDT